MFIQIAPRVKVFVTDEQENFIKAHSAAHFKHSELSSRHAQLAKLLADKAVFVRKKLDDDVQYALNRRIRFMRNEN